MVGFFEKKEDEKSMMRLLSFLGFLVGSTIAFWGMVLLSILVKAIMASNTAASNSIGTILLVISGGLALAGGGEVMKVIQQRSENKEGSK